MARPRGIPSLRFHSSGQSVVTFDGKPFYLGTHGSPEAQARYDTLIAKYLANGRRLWDDEETHQADAPISVGNIVAEYGREIESRPHQIGKYQHLCVLLDDEYGDIPADDFGPRKLAEIRDLLIVNGNSRKVINDYIRRIVMMFEHAVSRELADVGVIIRLQTLKPLRAGQTSAAEPVPRLPAPIDDVRAAAAFLSPQARAIVTVMVATGMRPSEVCGIRPTDIDRSGDEWMYRPAKHKTASHGVVKAVPIIGAARDALSAFLLRSDEEFCFSPAESAQWHRDERTANRKTPPRHGNGIGTNRKSNPKREPGKRFTKDSLNRAVHRACEKAGVSIWTPYQCRHLAATVIAEAVGLDGARAILSHTSDKMTMRYVHQKQDEQKAIQAARAAPSVG